MNGIAIVSVTILSGLYTSLWGAFKDSPYEGLKQHTFWRSVLFSLGTLGLLVAVPHLRDGLPGLALVQLFFLIMGFERIVTEIYKGFFRHEDQTKYLVPSRITFFGRTIRRERYRHSGGRLLLLGMLALIILPWTVSHWAGFILVGLGAGAACAIGGAYKDAPFEGFLLRKFPRSPLVTASFTPLLFWLGPVQLGFLIFIFWGLERFVVEYYKTYMQRRKAGKFRNDLPRIQQYLEMREQFHIVALFITHAAAYAWALWDGDWLRTRPIFWQAPPTTLLFLLLPLVHFRQLRPGGWAGLALYVTVAGLALVAHSLVILSFWRAERRLEPHVA